MLLIAGLWLVWAWDTLPQVPFHPDEATYLYAARAPRYWNQSPLPRLQHYRLVNAPLTRHLFVLVLNLRGLTPPPVDWLWEQTWDENQARGALPSPEVLTTARSLNTVLLALAGLALFTAGRAWHPALGALAALGFWLDPLVLLHGRRAMQEGPLLLAASLMLAVTLRPRLWAALRGLVTAIGLSAKAWALAYTPALLAAVLLDAPPKRRGRALFAFALTAALMGFLLHPILWTAPGPTAATMLRRRFQVTQRQVNMALQLDTGQALTSPAQRALFLLAHGYWAPLQYAEVGNYQLALRASQQTYDQSWWNHWNRGLTLGSLHLMLLIVGLGLMAYHARRGHGPRRWVGLYFLAGGGLLVLYLLALPLAWQRYLMAWVPWRSLGWAYGLLAPWMPRRPRGTAPA